MKGLLKQILNFDRQDWLHIRFLLKNSLVQLLNMNFSEAKEALYWVKIHISYDSNRVK